MAELSIKENVEEISDLRDSGIKSLVDLYEEKILAAHHLGYEQGKKDGVVATLYLFSTFFKNLSERDITAEGLSEFIESALNMKKSESKEEDNDTRNQVTKAFL